MANGMRYGYRHPPLKIAGVQTGIALLLVVASIGPGAVMPQFIEAHRLAYPRFEPDSASSSTGKSPATW